MGTPYPLEPICIIKEGYLVKSPPLDEVRLIRRRWRMRWFVLYDDSRGNVALFYYNSEQQVERGKPKGKISLIGAEVFKQRGRLHGYPYVINVQTMDRLYHLCSTQYPVHEDWLEKIRDHHVPNTEILRRSSNFFTCPRYYESRPSLADNTSSSFDRQRLCSVVSISSVVSNSDDESSYSNNDESFRPSMHKNRPRSRLHTRPPRPPSLPPSLPPPLSPSLTSGQEENYTDDTYITMLPDTNIMKPSNVESEDEGLGRSESDSSNTSTASNSNTTYINDSMYINIRPTGVRNSALLEEGFVGPKLSPTKLTPPKQRSMGETSIVLPPTVSTITKMETLTTQCLRDVPDTTDTYITMNSITDEGIGRSESDSSNTSLTCSSSSTYINLRPKNRNSLLEEGFVGPKLTTTKLKPSRSMKDYTERSRNLPKRRSMGDISIVFPSETKIQFDI